MFVRLGRRTKQITLLLLTVVTILFLTTTLKKRERLPPTSTKLPEDRITTTTYSDTSSSQQYIFSFFWGRGGKHHPAASPPAQHGRKKPHHNKPLAQTHQSNNNNRKDGNGKHSKLVEQGGEVLLDTPWPNIPIGEAKGGLNLDYFLYRGRRNRDQDKMDFVRNVRASSFANELSASSTIQNALTVCFFHNFNGLSR
jgi:hypothetical protein